MPQDPEEMTPETGIGQVASNLWSEAKRRAGTAGTRAWENVQGAAETSRARPDIPLAGPAMGALQLAGTPGAALMGALEGKDESPWMQHQRQQQLGLLMSLLAGLRGVPKGGNMKAPAAPKAPLPAAPASGVSPAPVVSELTRPWVGIYKGAPTEGRTVPKSYKAPKTYDLTEEFQQK